MSSFTERIMSRSSIPDRTKMVLTSTFLIENTRVKTIVLDMNTTEALNIGFKFKQYDYGTCFISAQLMDDETPINLDGHRILGTFRDSNGVIVVDENQNPISVQAEVMIVDEGVVKMPIPIDILRGYGNIDCEIVVFDSNNNRMTSPMFSFYIEKSIYDHEVEIPSNTVPICGEVLCGEAICGGTVDVLSEDIEVSTFLSSDFINRFKAGE